MVQQFTLMTRPTYAEYWILLRTPVTSPHSAEMKIFKKKFAKVADKNAFCIYSSRTMMTWILMDYDEKMISVFAHWHYYRRDDIFRKNVIPGRSYDFFTQQRYFLYYYLIVRLLCQNKL